MHRALIGLVVHLRSPRLMQRHYHGTHCFSMCPRPRIAGLGVAAHAGRPFLQLAREARKIRLSPVVHARGQQWIC
ncbi:hypothetical protein K788_0001013 [Paraburkholderia caribensis MBA4]|uniref:Uncharacterized protein n=1 Tax=Paraburkholderia caribensis MBA4 TaxID=1323664 RepID=A0A0P0RH61_9BURK|nr:hypothetical protein K788_0001013 [Paraburkholderia caribensis MBA4]